MQSCRSSLSKSTRCILPTRGLLDAQRALNTAKRQHNSEPRSRGVLDSAGQSVARGRFVRCTTTCRSSFRFELWRERPKSHHGRTPCSARRAPWGAFLQHLFDFDSWMPKRAGIDRVATAFCNQRRPTKGMIFDFFATSPLSIFAATRVPRQSGDCFQFSERSARLARFVRQAGLGGSVRTWKIIAAGSISS